MIEIHILVVVNISLDQHVMKIIHEIDHTKSPMILKNTRDVQTQIISINSTARIISAIQFLYLYWTKHIDLCVLAVYGHVP